MDGGWVDFGIKWIVSRMKIIKSQTLERKSKKYLTRNDVQLNTGGSMLLHLKYPGISASLGPGQAKSCCHQIRKAEHLVEEGSECVYHLPHSKMNIALKSQWRGILKLWSRVSPGEILSCIKGHCPLTDCPDFSECEWVSFVLTSCHRFILTAVSNWIPLKIYSFSTANSLTQGFSKSRPWTRSVVHTFMLLFLQPRIPYSPLLHFPLTWPCNWDFSGIIFLQEAFLDLLLGFCSPPKKNKMVFLCVPIIHCVEFNLYT